jgi:hypothetical protein
MFDASISNQGASTHMKSPLNLVLYPEPTQAKQATEPSKPALKAAVGQSALTPWTLSTP